VFGSLFSGFYLLRVYDMAIATYTAVAINLVLGLASFALSMRTAHKGIDARRGKVLRAKRVAWIYLAIGISGLAALGAEVVWTRLLSLLLGGTVYTFSLILAVFLVGLGIGSSVGASVARNTARPRLALGWCQALLVGALAWAAWAIAKSLPFWPVDPQIEVSNAMLP